MTGSPKPGPKIRLGVSAFDPSRPTNFPSPSMQVRIAEWLFGSPEDDTPCGDPESGHWERRLFSPKDPVHPNGRMAVNEERNVILRASTYG